MLRALTPKHPTPVHVTLATQEMVRLAPTSTNARPLRVTQMQIAPTLQEASLARVRLDILETVSHAQISTNALTCVLQTAIAQICLDLIVAIVKPASSVTEQTATI